MKRGDILCQASVNRLKVRELRATLAIANTREDIFGLMLAAADLRMSAELDATSAAQRALDQLDDQVRVLLEEDGPLKELVLVLAARLERRRPFIRPTTNWHGYARFMADDIIKSCKDTLDALEGVEK